MSKMILDKQGHPIVTNLDQVDDYLKPRNAAAAAEKLHEVEGKPVNIEHLSTANLLIDFINGIPDQAMHRDIKRIMIMRIGNPAINGRSMSHRAIGIAMGGMRVSEVIDLENIGKRICNDYLERVTLLEGAEVGNTKNKSLINDSVGKVIDVGQAE